MQIGPLSINRLAGNPIEHQGRRIIPHHLVAQVIFPGMQGGLIFNRPIAVQVEEPDQPTRTLPIINYTRLVQILVVGVAIFASKLFLYGRKS